MTFIGKTRGKYRINSTISARSYTKASRWLTVAVVDQTSLQKHRPKIKTPSLYEVIELRARSIGLSMSTDDFQITSKYVYDKLSIIY